MDNEKLLKERNEKLARFAGFCIHKMENSVNNPQLFSCADCGEVEGFFGIEYPDFEKVDECLKWLLPKIEGLAGVYLYLTTDSGYWWIVGIEAVNYEGNTLAEAIEKYVDWVKENEEC